MAKYRSNIGKYRGDKRHSQKNLYDISNPYNPRNPYKPLGYKGRVGTRRGYSSGARARSYKPSNTQHHQRQSAPPPYRPLPKQSAPIYPHMRNESHYKMPPRIEPDTEQMIKQLEKNKGDSRLHEQVLERLEDEFEKLKETLEKERAEKEELEEAIMRENEAFLEEHTNELIERLLIGDIDNPEVEPKLESKDKKQSEVSQGETEASPVDVEAEMPTEEELYEIAEKSAETDEEVEPRSVEELASQESASESEMKGNELDSPENPVKIEIEQLQDLEPILDQIEPIELEMNSIEKHEEITPETLPENVEEGPMEEGEAY